LHEFFFGRHTHKQVLHALVGGFSAGLAEGRQAEGDEQQREKDSHGRVSDER
jgi:hypothetical protein